MNKLCYILTAILAWAFTSCGNDEPKFEENKDWVIIYSEIYDRTHNNTPEFESWFNDHLQCFEEARFENAMSNVSYSKKNGDYIEWNDYSIWSSGAIEWVEIVYDKSEDEVKDICDKFSLFTIPESVSREYDKFSATYQKLKK